MSVKIPLHMASVNQGLDQNELFIRDNLGLNIDYWSRFRWGIHVGNNASVLRSTNNNPVSKQIKFSYIELAKSHYEVVTSLGCLKLSLNQLHINYEIKLHFSKNIKEFYYHAGRILDNIARLIYIINDKDAPLATSSKKSKLLMRHWIDWGSLKKYDGYKKFKTNKRLKEIINIRNITTHSWAFPVYQNSETFYWPKAIRDKRDLYWPYDELGHMNRYYKKWIPIVADIESDYNFLEKVQNDIFKRLIKDIKMFEKNNNIIIL